VGLLLTVAVVAVCGALANACPGLWVLMWVVSFWIGFIAGVLGWMA